MKKTMLSTFMAVAAACLVAIGADNTQSPKPPLEATAVAKMESRSKDPNRSPGIFGDYWWANRFLNRHQKVESLRGKTVDLVLVGDSIIHFWEWKHPASWEKLCKGRSVLNLGYGGDRTENVIWRIEHGELDGYKAKNIVLMIGTNNNSSDSTDPANVAKGIETIIGLIRKKQPEAQLIVHPIFPRGNASMQSKRHAAARPRNDKSNELAKSFVAAHPELVWIDFNQKLMDAEGWVPKELMPDGIHPSDAGYEIWMEAILPRLK
ncbi:MAG: hypothetical protein IKR48_13835 [Kiritimatiellae bacterium]|nr:hypothetical protein [Kiritimatiellia bacterium]